MLLLKYQKFLQVYFGCFSAFKVLYVIAKADFKFQKYLSILKHILFNTK